MKTFQRCDRCGLIRLIEDGHLLCPKCIEAVREHIEWAKGD